MFCTPITTKPGSILRSDYTDRSVDQCLSSEHTLAVFTFGGTVGRADDPRIAHTGLQQIDGESPVFEVWHSAEPVSHGRNKEISWAENGKFLFCSIPLDEANSSGLEQASELAYLSLLRFIKMREFPFIVRAWNYFAGINKGVGDAERYKEFCLGRHNAFRDLIEKDPSLLYPAACAIGHQQKDGIVYILAAKQCGDNFENPEQLSAYQYPREYGVISPSFARATIVNDCSNSCLYISGTASVKGHATIAPGNVLEQLTVTLDNIDRLLRHVGESASLEKTPKLASIKVYIRDVKDFAVISDVVNAHFAGAQILYVQGDICRSDLEVEIDGLCYL